MDNKKIEIAVKKIAWGMRVISSATLANPESLESYYKYQDSDIENTHPAAHISDSVIAIYSLSCDLECWTTPADYLPGPMIRLAGVSAGLFGSIRGPNS